MGPFEIAAIAIIGSCLTKAYTAWLKANKGNASQAKLEELERRIASLEAGHDTRALQERVQTLEEIVTTEEFDLQQKFRQLGTHKEPSE